MADQPEVSEAAVQVEANDQAFEAGFNQARGDESLPVETPPPPEAEVLPEPEPEVLPEQPVMAGLTESEIKALFAKAGEVDSIKAENRKLFGKLGELNSLIQKMQQPQTQEVQAKTVAKLERLTREYPELAEALSEDLGEMLNQSAPQADTGMAEKFTATERKIESISLSIAHPDWKKVTASDGFNAWKETLSDESRNQIDTSWDAEFIGEALTEYKTWEAAKQTSASQAQVTKQRNKERLQNAVNPTDGADTGTANILDENDAFERGFKNARGGG